MFWEEQGGQCGWGRVHGKWLEIRSARQQGNMLRLTKGLDGTMALTLNEIKSHWSFFFEQRCHMILGHMT